MFFGFWPELNFPGFNDGLFLLGFLLLFFQLVPEFVEIHNPANGRISLVGNLNQIKSLLPGRFQGFSGADYTALCSIRINEPNLAVIDILVDLYLQILLW